MLSVFLEFGRGDHARANQTHLSAKHIEELRQLVKAVLAKPPSEWGDSRIVGQLELLLKAFLQGGIGMQDRVRVGAHATELESVKGPETADHAPAVKNGSTVLHFDERGND